MWPLYVLLEHQGLSQLSLEQVAAAMDALYQRDFDNVEHIFNLCEGEAEANVLRAACAYSPYAAGEQRLSPLSDDERQAADTERSRPSTIADATLSCGTSSDQCDV